MLLLKFLILDIERRGLFAKEGREEALAGGRCRRRKDSGCTCGGGSRVDRRSLQRAQPGIEPRPARPKRAMLPLHHQAQ